ncbi:MAG: hypothetical protein GY815_08645 [Gammaproteobacteria bacterium]|nr:hypothetical protein [Gammaproteobacteria bacterium]
MGTNKLIGKVERFFDMSSKKQEKKHDKLLKIIEKLEQKKEKLQLRLVEEGKSDDTSSTYHELSREMDVIKALILKAKKQDLPDSPG